MTTGNPFSSIRAEHLGTDLATLFVPLAKMPRFGSKPVLVEGGRGSGKTMLFRYHSFDSKWSEHADASGGSRILDREDFLGFYHKIDDTVVPSMSGRSHDEDRWRDAFSSYLAYRLLREVFRALARFEESGIKVWDETRELASSLVRHEGKLEWNAIAETTRKRVYEVLEFANRPNHSDFHSLPLESALKDFVESVRENKPFAQKKFLFFIDEVECLNELQQRAVATLLRSSAFPVFYNLGCKVGGLASQDTLLSQSASELHDFERIRLNFEPNDSDYAHLVRQIFRKRIHQFEVDNGLKRGDIEDDAKKWLGEWSVDQEAAYLSQKRNGAPPYARHLRQVLAERGVTGPALETMMGLFTSNEKELVNRLHLVLLAQGKAPEELVEQYELYENGKSSAYTGWHHNYRNGILFLLARDYKRARRYYGFETFCLLSNGNIRVFIELCHAAFTAAKGNNLDFETYRLLEPGEQDTAARLISEAYIRDIRNSRDCSNQLYHFVRALGKTFKVLHTNVRQSEPEPNHFNVIEQDIDDDLRKLLRQAVMWSVLSEDWATKVKDPDSTDSRLEYILNRVYAPHFEISCRKNRSITLSASELRSLMKGNQEDTEKAAKQILSRHHGVSPAEFDGEEPTQVSLTKYGGQS